LSTKVARGIKTATILHRINCFVFFKHSSLKLSKFYFSSLLPCRNNAHTEIWD